MDHKADFDDKSAAAEAVTFYTDENTNRAAVKVETVLVDSLSPLKATDDKLPLRVSRALSAASCSVNSTNFSWPQVDATSAITVNSVKPGVVSRKSVAGASSAADNAVDGQSEMMGSDSSRRVSWLSGVSCTSSSTSGGEESPRAGYTGVANTPAPESLSGVHLPPHGDSETSTPVNGWSDPNSSMLRRVVKEEIDADQRNKSSRLFDGLGSISRTQSVPDGISGHVSPPNNSNSGMGVSPVLAVEGLYAGVGYVRDGRTLSSITASPESQWNSHPSWNSRGPIPEAFWASKTTPFHPQAEGTSSSVRSSQAGAGELASVPTGGVYDGSRTTLSMNGSSGDVMNSMQMAQNVSPSTPVAAPPSKKRVGATDVGFLY